MIVNLFFDVYNNVYGIFHSRSKYSPRRNRISLSFSLSH